MMRAGLLSLSLALAAAAAPPGEEIAIRVEGAPEVVELGKAFPLAVVRVFGRGLVPEEWSDASLEPLVVRLEELSRREENGVVVETRHFSCYAFSLREATVPGLLFRAEPLGGGPVRAATAEAFSVAVRPALDPANPGPPELPGDLLSEPGARSFRAAAIAALVAALLLILWLVRRRKRLRERAAAAPAVIAPHERALRRLEELRTRAPKTEEELDSYYVEASALMRDYLAERFAMPAHERTTEELLAAPQTAAVLGARLRSGLAGVLSECDLVKFGRRAPADPVRERLLDDAARIVEETRAREEPAAAAGAAPAERAAP